MRTLKLTFCFWLAFTSLAFAALHFPALSGRVVDEAHLLSPSTKHQLEQELADYERGTTNQVVVVTVTSLGGDAIDDYGYQLGRQWGIGQKGKDNGALLIVAPNQKKVRIEVGYGLEGTLTDAASNQIIQQVILPQFKQKHMEQGIVDGTHAVLDVLGGKSIHVQNTQQDEEIPSWVWLILLWFLWFAIRHPLIALWLMSGNNTYRLGGSRIGGSWGGTSSGGFSGGGGGFGGGGSSGSW
jgi:uncharacterized protein